MYNLLIGGEAGQGIDTTAAILEKILKKSGYHVLTTRDFMSRVRGGHNFSSIRFGIEEITSHSKCLDGIIALDELTVTIHQGELKDNGFILCDSQLSVSAQGIIQIPMNNLAKELGNIRTSGSIAVGAILKLFDENLELVEEVLQEFLKEEYLEINKKAVMKGFESVESKFPKLHGGYKAWMLISGNKAMALGAMAAGLKFYSAYPMSPSTSIMEYLASKADEAGIVVEQAEDEIAAINMAIGASFGGARAMTGTSGGGFSLKVEALGLSGMAEIPLVVVDVQRPGPATGLPTRTEQSDLKFVISAAQGEFPRMVIAIRNQKDAFYQTARGFYLAEKYQLPVILLSDQYIADSTATVEPFHISNIETLEAATDYESDGKYLRYKLTEDGISKRLIPGKTKHFVTADSDEHDEQGWITESAKMRKDMMDKRMKKLESLEKELIEPEFIGVDNFSVLLIGWGSTYGPIKEAIKELNKEEEKYAALVFTDVYPLPTKELQKRVAMADKIIDVEQNATAQFAGLVKENTGITCTDYILKYDGRQIAGEEIVDRIKKGGL